ncbi:MAG: LysM domain [Bradyrhizobium sp.]|jgi:LysM repeat protein|nr:LysM domain [Bradyrhizobium sp.]
MRWRALAAVSLIFNLLLAVAVIVSSKHRAPKGLEAAAASSTSIPGKTNVVVRRQFFSWKEVESPDYPTYIANLKDIGCPEQTIRDIIIADVNSLFAQRRATNLVTSEQQWWRSEPDSNVVRLASEKARELEEERRALLGRLLGTNWESGDLVTLPRPSRPGIILDGPLLGTLSAETKQSLQEISLRSQERLQAYLDEQRLAGADPDPAEVAKLRQETRTELEHVLSPVQLEEFLLRYSQNANSWRSAFGELRFFNPSPDEFRAVFRATDRFDQQLEALGDADDPASAAQRKSLEDQKENALKLTLGAKRYDEYRMLQDPLYRDAVAAAQAAGTPDAARAIYAVNLTAASEADRIRANADLTDEQKAIELKRLELEQLRANTVVSGQDLPPESSAPQAASRRAHVIRPGDTMATIALTYGLPPSAIRDANPGLDLTRLRPGDAILIPPLAGPAAGP